MRSLIAVFTSLIRFARRAALLGPGMLVMLADCDAGNVIVAAQGGIRWGYALLPVITLTIPVLYLVQDLSANVGLRTGQGFGELIRGRFGRIGTRFFGPAIAITAIATLITEYTGVASAGSVFGLPRLTSVTLASVITIAATITRRSGRVRTLVIAVALCQASFVVVAWLSRPALAVLVGGVVRLPLSESGFYTLVAATIGATFSPWMIAFQQRAAATSGEAGRTSRSSRLETAAGAVLTQVFTMAIVVAVVGGSDADLSRKTFDKVGDLAAIFIRYAGPETGSLLFGCGVLAASMLAALVCTSSLVDCMMELYPLRSNRMYGSEQGMRWTFSIGSVLVSALCAYAFDDFVSSNIMVQGVSGVLSALVIAAFLHLSRDVLNSRYCNR